MRTSLLLLLGILTALSALAADPPSVCHDDSKSPLDCENELWSKLSSTAAEKGVSAGVKEAQLNAAGIASAAVGLASAPSSAASTTEAGSQIDDLARFLAEIGLGQYGSSGNDLLFNWMPEVLETLPGAKGKLTTLARKPEVFAPLLKAFPETDRATKKAAFADALGDFDDIEWSLVLTANNRHFGRNLALHRSVVSGIYSEIRARVESSAAAAPNSARMKVLELWQSSGVRDLNLGESWATIQEKMSGPPEAASSRIREIKVAMESAFAQAERELDARDAEFEEADFSSLADLVNNQPQIVFSASYRRRDDLVGPDEMKGNLTWEIGSTNINSLRKYCTAAGAEAVSLVCYERFLRSEFKRSDTRATRFALHMDYTKTRAYRFADLAESFSFSLNPIETISGSVVLGTSILRASTADGKTNLQKVGRFELEVGFEKSKGDPLKEKERLVAVATISHEVPALAAATKKPTVSFSVVYANKPEFRGEVDKELSARLGLKYTFANGDTDGSEKAKNN